MRRLEFSGFKRFEGEGPESFRELAVVFKPGEADITLIGTGWDEADTEAVGWRARLASLFTPMGEIGTPPDYFMALCGQRA